MLKTIQSNKQLQLPLALIMGVVFGFLLQKGGVTKYDVIIGQLLLTDNTVVKIMLSAVVTGMIGIYFLKSIGLAQLHPKPGSFGMSVIGGLLFGVGFGTLGYCPGTMAGAVAEGWLDALLGGVVGALIGVGVFASIYPKIEKGILNKGNFGDVTIPQLLKVNEWVVIIPVCMGIIGLLYWLEKLGL